MRKRTAKIHRKTKETDIRIDLNIDGSGKSKIEYPIPFLGHMLQLFAKHGLFDLNIFATGDLEVDIHHLIEDTGLALGEAFKDALANKSKIERFGHAIIPMDEALAEVKVAIDISGRPHLEFTAKGSFKQIVYVQVFQTERKYVIDHDLLSDFFEAFVDKSEIGLHIQLTKGKTAHHKIEAIFKAFGVALSRACQINPRKKGVPSTKGML